MDKPAVVTGIWGTPGVKNTQPQDVASTTSAYEVPVATPPQTDPFVVIKVPDDTQLVYLQFEITNVQEVINLNIMCSKSMS